MHVQQSDAPLGSSVSIVSALAPGSEQVAIETEFGRLGIVQELDGVSGFEELRSRATQAEILGTTVWACSIDDLKAMERAACRHRDFADLENLEKRNRLRSVRVNRTVFERESASMIRSLHSSRYPPAMLSLEDLRDESLVGEVVFQISGSDEIHPLLFHDAARTAYYLTVDGLRNFEEADAVGPGPFVVPAIAFWFMATESYISTIYKACERFDQVLGVKGQSPAGHRLEKTQRIVEKAGAVKKWIADNCPPSPPQRRLQDFATFRNALFHDLTTHAPRTQYAHTRFTPRPEKCNQVDLFEALRVSLDVFDYFRFLFRDADLMPSVPIGMTFEKLDKLTDEVLEPAFADILVAKNLTSGAASQSRASCPAELRIPLQFLIRREGPTAPTSSPNDQAFAVDRRQKRALQARPVNDELFKAPNYCR